MTANRPQWTPAQREAIEHVDGALLLSAAAGSGKTAVLANRCVHLVCDAAQPCDVDELLVLTFTRAAAAEMRERIDRELRRRVSESSTADERLERQLRLIDRAAITTIDAFCGDLVRRNFNLVGVDPGFAILAPEDAGLLKEDVCDAMLEAAYDRDDATAFKALLDGYFNGDDAELRREIIRTHDWLQSVVDPAAWIASSLERLEVGTRRDPSELADRVATLLRRHLATARLQLVRAGEMAAREPKLQPYATHIVELSTELTDREALLATLDFDALAARVDAYALPRLPTIRGEVPGKPAVKARIDAVKDSMKGGPLRAFARWRWDDLRRDAAQIRGAAETLFNLVDRFADAFAAAKRATRALDFAQVERLALTILSDADAPSRPSTAAGEVQQRFRHVLVDEFQDINPMQAEILKLASRDRAASLPGATVVSNLFSVGDVKQSIYGFRLAEPRLFVQRDRELRGQQSDRGRVIDLQHNFRSRAPLLEAINDVFRNLMTEASADVAYDEKQELRPGADYPSTADVDAFAGRPIEIRLISDASPDDAGESSDEETADAPRGDRFDREVAVVARRIRELVCEDPALRKQVLTRGPDGLTARPIGYGDIAVLLRSARFKSSVVADALRALGIPVHSGDTSGFFEATEVQDVLSLLRLLSNGRQDVPLAAVLRSPFARIADADAALARVRIAYPDEPFHRAVRLYAAEAVGPLAEQLAWFLGVVAGWRRDVQERSIVDTLTRILRETSYRTFCRALPGGEQRLANLDELLARAKAFDSFERQGLDRFLRFVRELEAADQIGRPPIAVGTDDVVRVMTVHKSKGLEFPIVIVPDLGKRFNDRSLDQPILLDRDAGLGLQAVDLRKRIRYPSAASTLVRDQLRRRMLAEEIRVLYVAMTRAREHLILVGTGSQQDVDGWEVDWADHQGPLPDETIQAARTTLDWLGPIAAMTGSRGLGTFEVSVEETTAEVGEGGACAAAPAGDRLKAWMVSSERAAAGESVPAGVAASIARLTTSYNHPAAVGQAATDAVTSATVKAGAAMPAMDRAIARRSRTTPGELQEAMALDWPEAYRPKQAARASEIGAAVHRLLEGIDFSAPLETVEDVQAQIDQLVARRALTQDEAGLIDREAIRWFAATSLGRAIRNGSVGTLLREQPIAFARVSQEAADAGDFVLMRGRVDAMLVSPLGITLIDYKTDRVDAGHVLQRAETYAQQLTAYARALGRITGRPVIASHAVFLTAHAIVAVDPATGAVRLEEAV